jgi:hypothetical protein
MQYLVPTLRHLPLPGHHLKHNITLHHPFPQFPQCAHNQFIDVTELCLFCILFFSIVMEIYKFTVVHSIF